MDETRSAHALQGLLDISKALGSEVELNALLNVITKRASLIMEADRTTVFVFDPRTRRLWSRVGEGIEAGTIDLELGSGIAGDVAARRTLVNIPDAYKDPRFNPEFDRKTHYTTRSILCAPIVSGEGNLLGVIQSINKTTGERFDEGDESVMTALASHAGVALERAHLTEAFLEKNRFEESLKLAAEIQLGMLPKTPLAVQPGASFEIAAHLRPAKLVGGDFYDYRQRDGGQLYFCIGDVSGKGIPAALMMAVSRTLFRANSSIIGRSNEIMAAVNRVLFEETAPSMFVTAFCGILDIQTGVVEFSNAGHNPPILVDQTGAAREMSVQPGLVLGVAPEYRYQVETATLRPGEMIYLYTDGLSEQSSPGDEMYGARRLVDLLSSLGGRDAIRTVEATLESIDRFAAGTPQFDDQTVLCFRYHGPRSS
jgi:sigma-B regulation protein RsbU (phosphoserine phosphatase)